MFGTPVAGSQTVLSEATGASGAAGQPERLEAAEVREGGEAVPGLRLELAEIWAA